MKNYNLFILCCLSLSLLFSCSGEEAKKITITDLKDSTRAQEQNESASVVQELQFYDEHDSAINQEKFNQKIASGIFLPLETQSIGGQNEVHLITLEKHARNLEEMEVPDFSLSDLNGNTYNRKNTLGKVTVLSFWFTSSPLNVNEIGKLNELALQFKENNKVLWLAAALDNADQLSRFLKDKGWAFRFAADQEKLAIEFGVLTYPTHLIIDQKGQIVRALVRNGDSAAAIAQKINSLL